MKRYLITGGAGFIGSHLAEALLEEGHAVRVLDDLSTGKRENLSPQVELMIGDVADAAAVSRAMESVAGCFHLAAVASVARSIESWAETHRANQSGAVVVFEQAAARGAPVVYASSAAVYGRNEHLPLSETSETGPISPYGLDKLVCEWQAAMGAEVKGLASVGLRFFNVYGPRQDPHSPYSGVISIFMQKCRERKPLTIFGDGSQSRDFIYVGDVVAHLRASMAALEDKKLACGVYNVCTGRTVTVKELAESLCEIGGNPAPVGYGAAREGDIKFSCGDPSAASAALGVKAQIGLTEGLRKTWDAG